MAHKGATFKKHKGKSQYKRQKGGFYPSVMGTILKSGPIFLTFVGLQARKLLQNDKVRMASRKATRKTKRT